MRTKPKEARVRCNRPCYNVQPLRTGKHQRTVVFWSPGPFEYKHRPTNPQNPARNAGVLSVSHTNYTNEGILLGYNYSKRATTAATTWYTASGVVMCVLILLSVVKRIQEGTRIRVWCGNPLFLGRLWVCGLLGSTLIVFNLISETLDCALR